MSEEKKETNLDKITAGLGVEVVDTAQFWTLYLSTKKKRQELAKTLHLFDSPCTFCERFQNPAFNGEIEHECPHWALPLDNCRRNTMKWLDKEA